MQDLRRSLTRHPVFEGLSDPDMDLVVGCARNTRLQPGSFLFREGDPSTDFYLVRDGTVAIQVRDPAGGDRTLQTLHGGELVGWSWLIPPYRHSFDAKVTETTRALVLDGACLREKCEDDPRLGYELMQRMAGLAVSRLQNTLLQLLDVYAPTRS